ncbi:MAG: hypothetical protein ACK42L_03215, partial [Thermoanaerobaculum sp.]
MAEPWRKVGKPLVHLAVALQVLLLAAAAVGYLQGSRYLEFNLRRSVEHAAAQAVRQWVRSLELFYHQSHAASQDLKVAHLMPIPSLDSAWLVQELAPPVHHIPPLPGVGEGF